MKRGDTVFLVRPKRSYAVTLLSEHFPFPAVTVRHGGFERIVRISEIAEQKPLTESQQAAKASIEGFVSVWKSREKWTWQELGEALGIPAGAAWHKHQRAKRWGLL